MLFVHKSKYTFFSKIKALRNKMRTECGFEF